MNREQFENLSNIKHVISACTFNDLDNEYESKKLPEYSLGFINGAWYAYLEQQKDYVCDCGFLESTDEPEKIVVDNLRNELANLSNILSVFGVERFIDELDILMKRENVSFKKELLK